MLVFCMPPVVYVVRGGVERVALQSGVGRKYVVVAHMQERKRSARTCLKREELGPFLLFCVDGGEGRLQRDSAVDCAGFAALSRLGMDAVVLAVGRDSN